MATGGSLSSKHSVRRLLAIVAGAAVVCVLALVVSLGVSVLRVKGQIESACNSYEAAKVEFDERKYDAALQHVRSALNDVSAMSSELRGPQWSVASMLPILGTDAKVAQEMASIAGDLSDKAMLPILDEWDEVVGSTKTGLANMPSKLASALGTIKSSISVLYNCKERADALPKSHFGQLNDVANELRSMLSSATDVLDSFGKVANVVGFKAT